MPTIPTKRRFLVTPLHTLISSGFRALNSLNTYNIQIEKKLEPTLGYRTVSNSEMHLPDKRQMHWISVCSSLWKRDLSYHAQDSECSFLGNSGSKEQSLGTEPTTIQKPTFSNGEYQGIRTLNNTDKLVFWHTFLSWLCFHCDKIEREGVYKGDLVTSDNKQDSTLNQ